MKTLKVLALSSLALAAVAFAADGIVLFKAPAKGETQKYKLKANVDIAGMEIVLEAMQITKTTDVDADGNYTQTTESADAKITMNGQEMEIPMPASSVVFRKDGTMKELMGEGVDATAYRNAAMTSLVLPSEPKKVGDEWTTTVKGESDKGTVDMTGTMKIAALEQVDGTECAKIDFVVKETSGDAATHKGSTWIDTKNSTMVKTVGEWANMPFPGSPAPVSGKYSITLVK